MIANGSRGLMFYYQEGEVPGAEGVCSSLFIKKKHFFVTKNF